MPALTPCRLCGCAGIHACMGSKQKPMSKRAKKHFDDTIKKVIKHIKQSQELKK